MCAFSRGTTGGKQEAKSRLEELASKTLDAVVKNDDDARWDGFPKQQNDDEKENEEEHDQEKGGEKSTRVHTKFPLSLSSLLSHA